MFIFLHSNGLLGFTWQRFSVVNFKPEIGNAYQIQLGINWMSSHNGESIAQLLENGIPLGPGNSAHDDIRTLGQGRYSFWYKSLYFSASDNSDPRTNGRRYEIYWPFPIKQSVRSGIYAVSWLLVALWAVLSLRNVNIRGLKEWLCQHKRFMLVLSCFALLVSFLITRLPYFSSYRVPSIQPDSGGYYTVIYEMDKGKLPDFSYRTPGYPLFLKAVFSFADRVMAVVIVQNLLTLLAALFLVFVIYKTLPLLTPLAVLAMAGFISSSGQLISDIALLTESLFSGFLVLSFAFLILAVYKSRPRYFVLLSLSMAGSIYTRPSAITFIVIFILLLLYLGVNRFPRKVIFSLVVPFIFLLLLLPVYNFVTTGGFVISGGSAYPLIVSTAHYIEEDAHYPAAWNEAIRQVRSRVSKEDRDTVFRSWDISKFNKSYYKSKYWECGDITSPFLRLNYSAQQYYAAFKKIGVAAIRKHPDIFFKAFMLNNIKYFFENLNDEMDFYGHLREMYATIFLKKNFAEAAPEDLRKYMLKEFYNPAPLPFFSSTGRNDGGYAVSIVSTRAQKLHLLYDNFHRAIFRGYFWGFSLFMMFFASLFIFIRSSFSSREALVILALTLLAVIHGLFCSVISNVPRISAPLLFINYLSLALSPALFSGQVRAICGKK